MNIRGRVALMLTVGFLIIIGIVIAGRSIEEELVEVEPEVVDEVQVDPEPVQVDEGEVIDEADVIKEPFVAGPLVEIEASSKSEMGVLTNTSLVLTHFESVEPDDIREHMVFEPEVEFQVDQLDAFTYEISFVDTLERGILLKAQYLYENTLYGNSFLTIPNYQVESAYPADGSWEAKPNTIIEIKFNLPIDESIADYVSIAPEVPGRFEVSENILRFIPVSNLDTDKDYKVEILPGYEKDGGSFEGYSFEFRVNDTTYVEFGSGRYVVLSPDEVQQIPFYGDRNISNKFKNLSIYSVTQNIEECIGVESMAAILQGLEDGTYGQYLRDMDVSFSKSQYYGGNMVLNENLGQGIYYFHVDFGLSQKGFFAQVTNKCAYVTADKNEVLVWMTDGKNQDLEGKVSIGGDLIGRLNSDGFGVFDYEMTQGQATLVEIETSDEILYMPMHVGYSNDALSFQFFSYLDTDREIYRETDTIHVNGFLRDRRGYGVSEVEVKFTVNDVVLQEKTVSVSDYGDFMTSFSYEDIKTNNAYVEVFVEGQKLMSDYCYISDFEKPKYVLETKLDKRNVANKSTLTYYGKLAYYDGTPVPGGSVLFGLNTNQVYLNYEGSNVGEVKLTGETGAVGAEIKITAKNNNWRPSYVSLYSRADSLQNYYLYEDDYFYLFPRDIMLEAQVTEANGSGTISVACHDVIVDESVDPNDYDSFRGGSVSGQSIDVTIKETYYERVFVKQEYNAIYKTTYDVYKNIKHESVVYTGQVVTDGDGEASFDFDPFINGRYYTITLNSRDKGNNLVTETLYHSTRSWYVPYESSDEGFRLDIQGQDHAGDNRWNSYFALNEALSIELYFNNEHIISEEDKLLIVEERDGINHYHLSDETTVNIRMDQSRMPDTRIKAVYFNGSFMFSNWSMERYILIEQESLELDLTINFDKAAYEPGQEVKYEIKCKDREGNPTSSALNISVVDEAIFDIIEDDDDPLREFYQGKYHPNIIATFLLTPINEFPNMAEKGGEGGTDTFRDNFLDTSQFENVIVDDSGIYRGSFVLPDNITSWRVTVTGFDGDLLTSKIISNVSSGLPFFVDVLYEKRYLEGDNIGISLKSAGDLSLTGEMVNYYMTCYNRDNEILAEETYEGLFGSRKHMELGQLPSGSYTLEASVMTGEYKDGVRLEFEVTDHIANYGILVEEPLTDQLALVHNDNISSLSIYNEEARIFYNEFSSLTWRTNDNHNGRKLVAYLADEYRNQLFGQESDDSNQYIPSKGGLIKPLNNAMEDPVLTARLVAIGYGDYIDSHTYDELVKTLKKQKSLDYGRHSYVTVNAMAYIWMAVELGIESPDILDELTTQWESITTLEAKMMLLRACIRSGKYSRAEQVFEFIGYEVEFDTDQLPNQYSTEKEVDEMMQFMMLGVMVDWERLNEAKIIYDRMKDWDYVKILKYRIDDPEQLLYLMTLEPPVLEGKIKYELLGIQYEEVLGFSDYLRLPMSVEEANSFKLLDYSGDLTAIREYVGFSDDLDGSEQAVTKRYYASNGSDEIHVGDQVTVELTITTTDGTRSFRIQDILPAGLSFEKIDNKSTSTYLYGNSIGQMVDMRGGVTWKFTNVTKMVFRYTAIATSVGSYQSEPPVFSKDWEGKLWIGDKTWVTILE